MTRKRILMITPFIVLVVFFAIFIAFGNNQSENIYTVDTNTQTDLSTANNADVQYTADGITTTSTSENTAAVAKAPAGAMAKAKAAAAASKAAAAKAFSDVSHSNSKLDTTGTSSKNTYTRKVILSGNLGIETTKFDAAVRGITQKTEALGGFVASSNITGVKSDSGNYLEAREATFTIRIPSAKYDDFVLSAGNFGIIVSKTSSGEDITSQYYDSTARLNSQKIKEARLLDILKKTKTLSDILALETELESTRYQIESLTGTLKMWDDLVQFSTINISLKEVTIKKPLIKKPITLSDRINTSFKNSIDTLTDISKSLLVDFIAFLPFAVILILLMGIVFLIVKILIKRHVNRS